MMEMHELNTAKFYVTYKTPRAVHAISCLGTSFI